MEPNSPRSTSFGAESDLISRRAEIFRSKIISDFHLLETINEGGSRIDSPTLYIEDVIEPDKAKKMMVNKPHDLVRFHIGQKQGGITNVERRWNRIINKSKRNPPLDLWANWVVNSSWFQNFILALILVNSVVLGIQAEIGDSEKTSPGQERLILIMDIFDYFALLCFVVEIFLKWLDNFRGFWKNRWNIFDFIVTFVSFIPEIIKYSTGGQGRGAAAELTVIADNLRTFRVLRSLKMVSRFQKVRLIVLAVTKAFQAMVFITLLLFIFAYIFAIIGVIFFDYSAYQDQLFYKNSFSSILNALITLFQLFTLDHWLEVYKDVRVVVGQLFASLYVIVWIIIGSFIIRNIVVGIMVNNFQSIRNELFQEVGQIKEKEKRDAGLVQFAQELEKQNQRFVECSSPVSAGSGTSLPKDAVKIEESFVKLIPTQSRFRSLVDLQDAVHHNVSQMETENEDWQSIVEKNLENLAKDEGSFCWPRDSLFKYFLILEAFQENLHERKELLQLAGNF